MPSTGEEFVQAQWPLLAETARGGVQMLAPECCADATLLPPVRVGGDSLYIHLTYYAT